MTDRKCLKRMLELTEKLTNACNNEGYRSAVYNDVLEEISKFGDSFNHSRRRRPWYMIFMICFLLYCLAWIVWSILF